MYRATAEAVSGTKVFAGGKWLTCIGNRSVKVGDRIWTDGRCVYGNDLEAETPIVITPNAKAGIPIQIGNYLFTFYKGNLEKAEGTYSGRILNDTIGNVYGLTNDIAAANCYDNGDIFILDTSDANYEAREYDLPNGYEKTNRKVSIIKNGTVLQNIPLDDFISDIFETNYTKAESLPKGPGLEDGLQPGSHRPLYLEEPRCWVWDYLSTFYNYHIWGKVLYSFIEDDKNWAFIYGVYVDVNKNGILSTYSEDDGSFDPLYDLSYGQSYGLNIYYIDSTGIQTIIYSRHWLMKWYSYDGTSDEKYFAILENQTGFSELQKIKYPLQDGYYFKANIILPDYIQGLVITAQPLFAIGEIPSATLDIYSPDNKLLFSTQNLFGENFVITETAEDTYLVGIKPYANSDWNPQNGGLYICKNGNLTNLIEELKESEDEELKNLAEKIKNSYCNNYRLRKMKNIKNWWEDIQTLEIPKNNGT